MTYWLIFIVFRLGEVHVSAIEQRSMSHCAETLKEAAPHYPSNAILTCVAWLPDRRKP